MHELQAMIEEAFNERSKFSPKNTPADVKNAIGNVIELLDKSPTAYCKKKN